MSLDRELDQLYSRVDRLEAKVDKLLDFRGWILGVIAAISAGVSTAVALVAAWWSRPAQ
jgi:hypothetical protein